VRTMSRLLVLLVLSSHPAVAVTKKNPQSHEGLERIAISVNGKELPARDGETVTVFPHDRVKIKAPSSIHVNVVGLHGLSDGNREFRPEMLDRVYAIGQGNSQFRVDIKLRGKLIGMFTLAEVMPELQGVEVSVNERQRVMRENELMVLRRQDLFKVTRVLTNIPNNEGVEYEVLASTAKDSATHKLRFSLAGKVFGEVPIKVID